MIYEKDLSEKIIGCAFEVYNTLNTGLLEKVYENALIVELNSNGIGAKSQVPLEVKYKNVIVGDYYADILVEDKIILELKSCKQIIDTHIAQLINYLSITEIKLGYILNFGDKEKLEFKRIIK